MRIALAFLFLSSLNVSFAFDARLLKSAQLEIGSSKVQLAKGSKVWVKDIQPDRLVLQYRSANGIILLNKESSEDYIGKAPPDFQAPVKLAPKSEQQAAPTSAAPKLILKERNIVKSSVTSPEAKVPTPKSNYGKAINKARKVVEKQRDRLPE